MSRRERLCVDYELTNKRKTKIFKKNENKDTLIWRGISPM